jgi:glycosyltransferase involved in cell wall biosynthesis
MPEVAAGAAMLVNPESLEDVASALRAVANDHELAASMRTKGLARAAQFSWKSFAEVHVSTYREILPAAPSA